MLKKTKKEEFPGYPEHPESEDIFNHDKEEADLDPEDTSKKKSPNPDPDAKNEKDFAEDMTGGDLDVPGSELDDDLENTGNEDEENNYYSLGGDDHHGLEEDHTD